MDPIRNPYAPGAGTPPPELAGREDIRDNAKVILGRSVIGRPTKSMVMVGLRGVGKTVLLDMIRQEAERYRWFVSRRSLLIDVRSSQPKWQRKDGRELTRWPWVATLPRMRSVGINVLNSRLSEYVRLAAAGETILVTDRDRVVAELGPVRETRSRVLADAVLADAVRSGVLTPPALAGSGPPPVPLPVAPLDEILSELDANRRDR